MTRNAWWVVIGFIVAVGLIVVIALDDDAKSDEPEPTTAELTDTQLLALSIAIAGSDITQAIENASGERAIAAADIQRLQAQQQARVRARQRYLQELNAVATAFGTLGAAAADADNAEALAAKSAELQSTRVEIRRAVAAAAAAVEGKQTDAVLQAQLDALQQGAAAVDAAVADAIAAGEQGNNEAAQAFQQQATAIQEAGQAIDQKLQMAVAAVDAGDLETALTIFDSIAEDMEALEAALATPTG